MGGAAGDGVAAGKGEGTGAESVGTPAADREDEAPPPMDALAACRRRKRAIASSIGMCTTPPAWSTQP